MTFARIVYQNRFEFCRPCAKFVRAREAADAAIEKAETAVAAWEAAEANAPVIRCSLRVVC